MNRLRNLLITVPALFLAFNAISPWAQGAGESDLSWSTIDGGGGVSAGDTYRISGSIGQPDAGSAGSGGYDLLGGFWGGIGAVEPATPTATPTFTATATASHTLTETPTSSPTETSPPPFTETPTPTATEVVTLPTSTPSPTDTVVPVTPTSTITQPTPTVTTTVTATVTVTPTATGTPTASATPTATITPTVTVTATVTPTAIPGDTNGDGQVDASDIFHFARYWGRPADEADPRCNPVPDDVIDENDLLSLTREWK